MVTKRGHRSAFLAVEAHSRKRLLLDAEIRNRSPSFAVQIDMTTIRERSVQWLIDNPGDFTVNRLATDLGLERRQALNALHGLKQGLGDQLQHHGSGSWSYSPRTVLVLQTDEFGATGPTTKVPLGWVGRIRVIAREGNRYLTQVLSENGRPNGLHLAVSPVVGGVERLDPFPD